MSDLYTFNQVDQPLPWARDNPNIVSDFSARVNIITEVEMLQPTTILDLGCGEGYLAHRTSHAWSKFVGLDSSSQMINEAKKRAIKGATFLDIDLTNRVAREAVKGKYELITAIFLFNYFTLNESKTVVQWALEHLAPRGVMIITHPHPIVTYSLPTTKTFSWQSSDNYFATDTWLNGKMATLDKNELRVGAYHKTFQDLLSLTPNTVEFTSEFEELGFLTSDNCPHQFLELVGKPLHVKIKIIKK